MERSLFKSFIETEERRMKRRRKEKHDDDNDGGDEQQLSYIDIFQLISFCSLTLSVDYPLYRLDPNHVMTRLIDVPPRLARL